MSHNVAHNNGDLGPQSRPKLKQFTKPWITNGILKSIKNKQKMYRTHFFSNNSRKIEQYQDYSNKLNKIKSVSKKNYYTAQFNTAQFNTCKNNLKATYMETYR
jgi:CRISPR/Cas system-associated endonuclease Cas1